MKRFLFADVTDWTLRDLVECDIEIVSLKPRVVGIIAELEVNI